MDFKGRLERAREEMRKRGIGLMYLRRGANLWYLTGVRRSDPEMTEHNAYGDYVCGAYIGADGGLTLVGPRMGGSRWRDEAEDKPWVEEVVIFNEHRRPKDVLNEVVENLNVSERGVSVDDRAWTQTSLLLRDALPGSEITLTSDIVAPMRMIKDDEEVALMKKAGEITDEVFGEVVDFLKVGVTEVDVAHEVDYQFAKRDVEYSSFVTGVRFSSPEKPRGLHGLSKSERKLEEGDTISFDFGACYKGYCSDFGRTVFVGDPPDIVVKIHDLVMEAQTAAIAKMVDGTITATGLDRIARGIIEDAGYGDNFVHRLGHGIGVTVHEPPFLYIPDETVLRTGMTFTVEPSIILQASWSVRVEDVVMVTDKGGISFSNYHKELTII